MLLYSRLKGRASCKSEDGSTLVLTAIGMVVIMAFAGLSIDVGNVRYTKRHLQSAVDAAAIAAALEIPSCNGSTNCSAMLTAAQTSMAENGFPGAQLLTDCSAPTGTGLSITVDNPPCAQGGNDPNNGQSNYAEVIATATQKTFFAGMIGFRSFPISVRAEAARTPNPNCIYALDPNGGNAITVDLLASVTSACGIVDESSAWNALSCNLIASVKATQINVVGGVQGFLCNPHSTPRTGIPVPTPADPLSALPKPAIPACGTSNSSPFHGSSSQLIILGPATLYPDKAYCGGIIVGPLANVTFMPGTYVIESNGLLGLQGGLSMSLLANVKGNGVTFYNLGPRGSITFLAPTVNLGSVSLIAPTSGTYACMLFMQDPQNTDGANIIASADWNTYLEGGYYFPNANVLYAAALPVKYNILVAKDIEFAALSFGSTNLKTSFNNDYSSISHSCPMSGGGSVLVQ